MQHQGVIVAALALVVAGVSATVPFAPMLYVIVEPNSEVMFSLPGFDADGDKLTTRITSGPSVGTLYQLSQVFSDYGYEPKRGVAVAASGSPVVVTGSKYRLLYVPPPFTNAPEGKWATFTYTVTDKTSTSVPGIVWLVPPHHNLVYSGFSTSLEGWSITGNGMAQAALAAGGLTYEPYSRGLLNHYVIGTDAEINTDVPSNDDLMRWSFVAPAKFRDNFIIAYGGSLVFTLASAAGDFAPTNINSNAKVVVLDCSTCLQGAGLTLVKFADSSVVLDGKAKVVRVPLLEGSWKKDPRNVLTAPQNWVHPTQCEMVEALQGITGLTILGDHTRWYESVGLDQVSITHGTGGVPMACASIYY